MSSLRRATSRESSCLIAPAAALRGLANLGSPCSSRSAFVFRKTSNGMKTSPRISISPLIAFASFLSRNGMLRIVRAFCVHRLACDSAHQTHVTHQCCNCCRAKASADGERPRGTLPRVGLRLFGLDCRAELDSGGSVPESEVSRVVRRIQGRRFQVSPEHNKAPRDVESRSSVSQFHWRVTCRRPNVIPSFLYSSAFEEAR